jgi:hypothetical protein
MKYCKECESKAQQEKANHNRYYDKNVRNNKDNKKYSEFYHSKEWEITRDSINSKCNGICLYSYLVFNEVVYVGTVHHIEELKDNWDRRLDKNNLIPLSLEVHNMIHAEYNKSETKKKEMQKVLFSLLEKFKCS